MIWLLIAVCLCFVLLIGRLAIPSDVWELIGENCRDSRGRLKPSYVYRELQSVADLYLRILFLAGLITIVVLIAFMLVDEYLIPADLIAKALEKFDPDFQVWKNNLNTGPDSFRQEYEQHVIAEGGTSDVALVRMRFLWGAVPLAFVGVLVGVVISLRLTSKTYRAAIEELVAKAAERNKLMLAERYLRETSQPTDDHESDRHRRGQRRGHGHRRRRRRRRRQDKLSL